MIVKTLLPRAHSGDPDQFQPDYEPECRCCPLGRSGHRIIVKEDCFYSLGGFNPALGSPFAQITERGHPCLFKELWKFNLSTHAWQLIDDFYSVPPTIASHTAASVGRWLFLFGGTAIPFGETPTSSLYRYNLTSSPRGPLYNNEDNDDGNAQHDQELVGVADNARSRWKLLPVEGDVPDERYGHTMTMRYPDVYIVGGTSGYIYNSDVYHLNLSTPIGKWTKLSCDSDTRQPVGRYRHETAFDGDNLYVFGGGTDRDAFSLVNIHSFNVHTGHWGTLKSFPDPQHGYPKPRKCHSCCQLNTDVFMVGGVSGTTSNNEMTSYDDIWRFSLTTASWRKLMATLPLPLYFHSAEIVPAKGCMIIFGGVTKVRELVVRTRRVMCVRVTVGDLLELAWEVVAARLRNCHEDVDLNDLGIPLSLQGRLFD